MPVLQVETAEGLLLRTELAGVGSRLAAGLLDLLIALAGLLTLLLILIATVAALEGLEVEVVAGLLELLAGVLVGGGLFLGIPLYFALFQRAWNGQTPGKRALRLRVVGEGGAPAPFSAHLLRSVVWLVDALLLVPAPLGLLMIGLTPRCRRLGDLAAGTYVISEAAEAQAREPWPEERWSTRERHALALSPGMAARLSDEDVALLRDAVSRRGLPPREASRLYRELARHYAGLLGFEPAQNDRVTLKELYLFARELRGS